MDEHGVTHVAFGMGQKRIALVPIAQVKKFIKTTNTTKNADKSIRHYHVLISDGAEPEMYWSATTPRVMLKDYMLSRQSIASAVAGVTPSS